MKAPCLPVDHIVQRSFWLFHRANAVPPGRQSKTYGPLRMTPHDLLSIKPLFTTSGVLASVKEAAPSRTEMLNTLILDLGKSVSYHGVLSVQEGGTHVVHSPPVAVVVL